MCEHHEHTKSLRSDIAAGLEEASRPFRRDDQEARAREVIRAALDVVLKLTKSLWAIMEGMAKERGAYLPPLITVAKRFYDEDIEALTALFNVATPAEMEALTALFESFGLDMRAAFERELALTYQQGLDIAYENMNKYAGRQDPRMFAQVPAGYVLNTQSSFYRSFITDSLDLVRDKVSVEMRDKIFERLANAIATGRNWQQMADDLYNNFGLGKRGRYHWVRIVRTEMGRAYESSQRERYEAAGMQFVKRSLANGACPICKSLSGVWRVDKAPRLIVHPNCRCSYIPYYRLPAGAVPREPTELTEEQAVQAGFS